MLEPFGRSKVYSFVTTFRHDRHKSYAHKNLILLLRC